MIGLEYIVKEFKMEYKEVAKILGITPQTINDWLTDRKKIPKKRLEQLSTIFNCPKAYFQKELFFTEMAEVRVLYLQKISVEYDVPVSNDEGETVSYYKRATFDDEIQFLKETMEKKKKQNDIRKKFEELIKNDALLTIDESYSEDKEPLLSDSSNTETLNKIINVLRNEKKSDEFKVMVHLLNFNDEFGGNPIPSVSLEYRNFAEDFLELLKNHKIK